MECFIDLLAINLYDIDIELLIMFILSKTVQLPNIVIKVSIKIPTFYDIFLNENARQAPQIARDPRTCVFFFGTFREN